MLNIQSIPISDIVQTTSRTEQITVRVMRLWWKKSETDPTDVQGVELILVDQNGDTIQTTIKKKLVKHFLELVNEGDTYKIRKFSTSSNRMGYDMATYHPCKIWFEYSTRVVPITIAEIPLCVHSFYTFNEFFFGAMPDKLYVDVIGKLEHIYPIKVNSNGKRRRTIVLGNNQNQQLCCTLFGDYVDQMTEIDERFKNQMKPTLVLLYIKRSVYEGEVSITTWGASKILVNPAMNEVYEFNNSFPATEVEQNLLGAPENAAHHPLILASANIKTLAEIQILTTGGSYVTMATFVELNTSGVGWFYNSGKECRLKVHQRDDGLWYCDKEPKNKIACTLKGIGQQSAIPRYTIIFEYHPE